MATANAQGRDKVERSPKRRTQLDVAFDRLRKSPATRAELVQAITETYPSNKGTRAYDLLRSLTKRDLLDKKEDGRFELRKDAIEKLEEEKVLEKHDDTVHVRGF